MSYSTLNFDRLQGSRPPNIPDTTGIPQSVPDRYNSLRTVVPRVYYHNVYYLFFSAKNVAFISDEITNRLTGVHPQQKNIIVPDDTIISVMDSIYNNTYRDVDKLTMMTIQMIVDHIKTEYQTELQNSRLSAWVQNFGDETGLRQFSPIKLREKTFSTYTTQWNY